VSAAAVGPTAARCRRAIFVTMSAVALAALLAAGALTVLGVREALLDRHAALLENVAAGRARMMRALDRGWRDKAALIAAQPGLRGVMARLDEGDGETAARHRRALAGLLDEMVAVVGDAAAIRVFDADGSLVAASRAGGTLAERGPTIRELLARGGDAPVIVAYRPREDGTARVDVAAPVRHENVRLGLVLVALETRDISRVAADRTGLAASGEILVVRRLPGGDARLLTAPRHPPHRAFAVHRDGPSTPVVFAARGRVGTFVEPPLRDYRGVPVLASIQVLEREQVAIVAKTDRADVLAPLQRLALPLGAIGALVAGGALVGMRRVADGLTRRLADSEARVAAIVDIAADGIVWLDRERRVRALNPAAEYLLGTTQAACLGRPIDMLESVVEGLGLALALDNLLGGDGSGPPWRGDLHVATPAGEGRDLEVAVAVCELADGRFAALTLHDVSDRNLRRRQLERALSDEQAGREQQRSFVATVSHEFRTPLAVIDATARQLLRRRLPPETKAARLQQIRDTVTHLTRLMERVLDTVRAEHHEPALRLCRLSLSRLVRTAVADARGLHPDRVLVAWIPPEDVWIDGDATAVGHIVDNLLTNALKYAPTGTPVQVTLARLGDAVRLFVIDHGRGVPAADQGAIFDRFHRAANVGAVPGTGLGLHIARELAMAHGGGITVASREGVGAAFTVSLPAAGPPTGSLAGL
jgi:PAS domain S-box-containing protein